MNIIKKKLKYLMAGALGILILISSSSTAGAATSDQVTLSVAQPGAGYVNTVSSDLRVRSAPNTSATVLTSLPKDSMIMIVGQIDGFYKVQYDQYGHYGYVAKKYVIQYDLDHYCIVTSSSNLNIRAGSGTSYEVKGSIPSQKSVPLLLEMPDWNYIIYGNLDGYISKQYVTRKNYE